MRQAAALLLVLTLALPAPAASAQAPLKGTPVVSGLNGPIDIVPLPDGSIWWNEYYTGNVTRQAPDGTRTTMFHADPLPKRDERGLLGLAVDMQSWAQKRFFVYYSVYDPNEPDRGTNRLVRIDDGKETLLLTTEASFRHNGGRILITPERNLFVSTGETNLGHPAQDPESNLGKILLMDQDGKPVGGGASTVYSLGHRNVYGLAYDATAKRLFATENGNAERDEVNEIKRGANYGWPLCEGHSRYDQANEKDLDTPCDDERFTPPIGEFYESRTAAPTGAAILHGTLYWASWNEGAIHRMTEGADGTWKDEVVYKVGGRMNDLEAAPDGSGLYYSNWTHIVKVEFPRDGTVAAIPAVTTATVAQATTGATSKGAPGASLAAVVLAAAAALALARRRTV